MRSGTVRRVRDMLDDVLIELDARRGRTLLLLIAVALSTGSLISSVGVSATAARQIDADLAASGTDLLTVRANPTGESDPLSADPYFTADAVERATSVSLVQSAGLNAISPDRATRLADVASTEPAPESAVVVSGATSGYLTALGAESPSGWALDSPDMHVVLLGAAAAKELGLPRGLLDYTGYRVLIGGKPFDVAGVLIPGSAGGLDHAALVPIQVAQRELDAELTDTLMIIRTAPGAGAPVAAIIREALRPESPGILTVSTATDLSTLRTGVSTQMSRFAAVMGLLLVALTTLLIGNSMITAVVSRTAEIGLRRALGDSRAAVTTLFLIDGAMVGLLGGIAGSALGVATIDLAASVNGWSAFTPWYCYVAGPFVGVVVAVIASSYPALRAGGISPAEAVRAAE